MKFRNVIKLVSLLLILLFGSVFLGIIFLGEPPKAEAKIETDCSPTENISNTIDVTNLPPKGVGNFNKKQLANAAVIINEAKKSDLKQQGAIIGLMTGLQESSLRVLANDGTWEYKEPTRVMTREQWDAARKVVITSLDLPHEGVGHAWDALGIMQQRPSAGWGSVEQIMNPSYAAQQFFDRLKKVPNWESLPYELAAEKVQISGQPDNYANQRADAEMLYAALQGAKVEESEDKQPYAKCEDGGDTRTPDAKDSYDGKVSDSGWVFPVKEISMIQYNYGEYRGQYPHAGEDFSAPKDTPIFAAADGQVIRASCAKSDLIVGRSPCQIQIDHGKAGNKRITTLYVHMFESGVLAKVGQEVKAGDQIGKVGTNGNSTGYHLHFEVWLNKELQNPVTFLKDHGVKIPG